MAQLADVQRKHFLARIDRIQKGGPNTMGTIYAGPAETNGSHVTRPKKVKRERVNVLLEIFVLPFAVAMGAAAMLAGRAGAYHLSQRPDLVPAQYADLVSLSADWVVAAFLVTIFAMAFRLGRGLRCVALFTGFLGVMLGEPLLVVQAPDLFQTVFSPEYVAEMQVRPTPFDA